MNRTFLAPCLLTLLTPSSLYLSEYDKLLTEPLLLQRWQNMHDSLKNKNTSKDDLTFLLIQFDEDQLVRLDQNNKTLFDHAVENNRPIIAKLILDAASTLSLSQSIVNDIDNIMLAISHAGENFTIKPWLELQQMANLKLKSKPLSKKQKLRRLLGKCLGLNAENL